ncbi:MAG: nuclear transport factor 2 family protein [Acidimicrobiia bacterium]|nr:nuclear transport factor 2 family protein [Acidimicrobiia bacterium]
MTSLLKRTATVAGVFAAGVLAGVWMTDAAAGQKAATTPADAAMDVVVAKDEIRERLYTYGRGLDRADWALALSPYHADAQVRGVFTGTAKGWIDAARRTLERETASSHQMTNILITVDADRAGSETYFIVSQHAAADSGAANAPHTSLVRGRYLDRWARRDGRWAITDREIIVDFSTNDLTASPFRSAGRRDRTDPSYAVLGE